MNPQQEAVALYKFFESRGLKPSVRSIGRALRDQGMEFRETRLREWLSAFVKSRDASQTQPIPERTQETSTADAARMQADANGSRLHAQNKVSLLSEPSSSSLRSEGPKPRREVKPPEEWTVPLRASVAAMNEREIISLLPRELNLLARFHALEFANCTRNEVTNKSKASAIASGLTYLLSDLKRRGYHDLTIAEYVAFARRVHKNRDGTPWHKPAFILPEIHFEDDHATAR